MLDTPLVEIENPVRVEIVPKEQVSRPVDSIFVRVSYVGKDVDSFYFLVHKDEKFSQTKKRLMKITGDKKEEFDKYSFRAKLQSNYGAHFITNETVLAKIMNENDKLVIILPGYDGVTTKKRSDPVSTSLKINVQ